jgi:catechol 2,3-dioxygenase-like lactoylglutathione lyase family enzyme
VLFVRDLDASAAFYTSALGFSESWRHAENGQALVLQVARQGCELILTGQWPEKAGSGLMFISLDQQVLDDLRSELKQRGVAVADGHWGYRVMIVRDPDGNELYFPYADAAA